MPEQSPTLRDMIKDYKERSGLTYEQIAERAIDPVTSEPASGPFINNIALGNVARIPVPYHLRAIAAALEVPYGVVRAAAINQWLPAEEAPEEAEADRQEMIRDLLALKAQAKEAQAKAEEALRRLDEMDDGESEAKSA